MKTFKLWQPVLGLIIAANILFSSCETLKNEDISPQNEELLASTAPPPNQTTLFSTDDRTSSSSPYVIRLDTIIDNDNGTWTWSWSAHNPNPGDGLDGTIQDLDHWDMTLGHYATMSDLVSGEVSTDGITWTTFRPEYRIDINQSCASDTVVQLNLGTRTNLTSYYRITVNRSFTIDDSVKAIYVSGRETGCGTFEFSGFGRPTDEISTGCSFGQGYYFSKDDFVWSSNVSVGGYSYTQAEAKAIYETSNKGGVRDSKYGFINVVVIKMSEATISRTATVWADLLIVENLPTGNSAVRDAAKRLNTWIDTHRCDN
jgi:hypothetical protein